MKKALMVVLALGIISLLAMPTHAGTLQVISTGTQQGLYIQDPARTNSFTYADLFKLKYNGTMYDGFCVDYGSINFGTVYDSFTMIDLPDVTAYQQAAYIMNTYGKVNDIAAQIAVWEVVFEGLSGSGPNLVTEGPEFKVNSFKTLDAATAAAVLATAQTYVDDAEANAAGFDSSAYRLLVSPMEGEHYGVNYQDFIVKAPEPSIIVLLGCGLLGLLGIARRKSAK